MNTTVDDNVPCWCSLAGTTTAHYQPTSTACLNRSSNKFKLQPLSSIHADYIVYQMNLHRNDFSGVPLIAKPLPQQVGNRQQQTLPHMLLDNLR
jgi:hypothetical protein